jgi:beta-glucanase (GH16 family)
VRWSALLPIATAVALASCGWEGPGSSSPAGGGEAVVPTAASPPSGGSPAAGPPSTADGLEPAGYRLVWRDEFDGTALDAARWRALSDVRRDAVNAPEAVGLRGGALVITTYTEAGVHRTGFVTSEGSFGFTYGYVEARIRLFGAPGSWCAFWLNSPTNGVPLDDPATAGTEIDMLEHRLTDQDGVDVSNVNAMNVNWNGYGADHQFRQRTVSGSPPLQGNWHTYGVLWTPTGYTFYLDGTPVWTPSAEVPVSRRSEFIHLTCEVENRSWAGFVPVGGYGSRDASTARMEVDWVRVWQQAP